jgi:hypothetical protein
MELDQLKSTWNISEVPAKTTEELKRMLLESKHPVLKEIRKQFVIEIAGWSVFLLCYYTMFDGDQKPLWVNFVLVITMLSSLLHNLSGYSFSRFLPGGNSIKASLDRYLKKIRTYASISIFSRIFLMTGFMLFFTFNIQFTTTKYLLLVAIALVFALQLLWLSRLWVKRISALRNAINNFL